MSELVMYDAIDVANLPEGGDAYAGYVGGKWPTWAAVEAKFKGKHLVSIAIDATEHALCLDVETGDATPAQVPGWVRTEHGRGVARPIIYASVSLMSHVLGELALARIPRDSVRLWSAHYDGGKHVCGPATCKQVSVAMDGTQWTDQALGRSLDESLLDGSFFADAAPKPPPPPPVLEGYLVTRTTLSGALVGRAVISHDNGKTWS